MDERRMYITEADNGYFVEMNSEAPYTKKVFTTVEELLKEVRDFFDPDIPF